MPGRREYPPPSKPHREAGDPIGVELSITAGEPKANPRTGPRPIKGPHRGPTSHYRGYAAGTPAECVMLPHAKALHNIGRKCDPYGVEIV